MAPATDRTTNVADNIITETVEDRIDQMDNHMDAIQNEFINENNDEDNLDNVSASIAGYCESEDRIAQLEANMDERYGTRLRTGLRQGRARNTIPTKNCNTAATTSNNIEEQLHLMNSNNLSLKDYANLYAAIHHSGLAEKDNYLKNDMVSTILTQYHVSKGLKNYREKGVAAVLKELRQLHDRMVMEPQFANDMTEKQKK